MLWARQFVPCIYAWISTALYTVLYNALYLSLRWSLSYAAEGSWMDGWMDGWMLTGSVEGRGGEFLDLSPGGKWVG